MTQIPIVLTAGILPAARTGQRIPVKMLRILTRTAQSKLFAKNQHNQAVSVVGTA